MRETVEAEHVGTGGRQIDDAPAREWTSVIDADQDGASVALVGHANYRTERQRTVRRREIGLARVLTIGGPVPPL